MENPPHERQSESAHIPDPIQHVSGACTCLTQSAGAMDLDRHQLNSHQILTIQTAVLSFRHSIKPTHVITGHYHRQPSPNFTNAEERARSVPEK